MTLLLFGLDFGQLGCALFGVGSQCFLAVEGGVDFTHQLCPRQGDGRQVMQVARHLVGVVAVENELQRIGCAAQVLLVEQFFQLCLLLPQGGAKFLGLLFEIP